MTRQPYDPYSGMLRGDIVVAGIVSICLAIVGAFKGYHRVAPLLVLWAVGAMIMIPVGLNVVRMAPDG